MFIVINEETGYVYSEFNWEWAARAFLDEILKMKRPAVMVTK